MGRLPLVWALYRGQIGAVRVHVVSDVHGNLEALGRAAEGADLLVVLGDLVDKIDYHDPRGGILGAVFGRHRVVEMIRMRTAGAFAEMHAYEAELWNTVRDPEGTIAEVLTSSYSQVIDLLRVDTLVTLGNVDMEQLWSALAPYRLRCLDGECIDVGGLRFGFVAGGSVKVPPTGSPWRSFDRSPDRYRSSVERLSNVDVLCSHVPPNLEDLRFDIASGRQEMYGPGLLEAIDRWKPALALFGHVHTPKVSRLQRGGTACVNVGCFRRDGRPFVFDTDLIG